MTRVGKQSVVVKNTLYEVMHSCFPVKEREAATRILALLISNELGLEQGVSTLKFLNSSHFFTRIYAEESYFKSGKLDHLIELSCNDDWTQLVDSSEEIEDDFDHLFLPVTSFSLVSELIHFNDRRPLARIIQRALFKGKKVTMVEDTANPYSKIIRENNWDRGTNFMKSELLSQLKKLQRYGVTLIHSDQVKPHFQMQGKQKKVVTEEDVLLAGRKHQQVINLSRGTLITPLARDTAKELGILLSIE
jgi:hypothetical protein